MLQASKEFEFVPFRAEDVLEFDANASVLEMHDRMIVGVAKKTNANLLSCDQNIVKAAIVPIVW